MASPKDFVFFVLSSATGLPATGLTPTFATYKDNTGANVSQPAITEIGGGLYKFTPVFADPAKYIAFVISTGQNPPYQPGYLRPSDFYVDALETYSTDVGFTQDIVTVVQDTTALLLKHATADERVHTSGPSSGRAIRYDSADHSTVLGEWEVFGEDGTTPDVVNPYYRRKA